MFRKTLIAILALLIAAGTAFAKPRLVQPPAAAIVQFTFFPTAKATRFRVSRPVMVHNPKLADAARQLSRNLVAG